MFRDGESMKKEKRESTGAILDHDLKSPKVKIGYTAVYIIAIIVSLTFIIPIFWILLSAFKGTKEFSAIIPTLFPEQIELAKIGRVWSKVSLGRAYLSTIYMMAGCLAFSLVSNGLAGYVLSRLKPKGSAVVSTVILWSMMLPSGLSMVPLFISFTKNVPFTNFNLMDSYVPIWMMAGASAFNVLLFKSFFDGISTSYLEAARIDGCSEVGIFCKIVMPLSKPVFFSVAIFVITGGWGQFLWPYLLIKTPALQPIGVRTYLMQSELAVDEYFMMLIFVVVPPVLFFCFFQKYIMDGVSVGGIKG